jgi:hypothetical protein
MISMTLPLTVSSASCVLPARLPSPHPRQSPDLRPHPEATP